MVIKNNNKHQEINKASKNLNKLKDRPLLKLKLRIWKNKLKALLNKIWDLFSTILNYKRIEWRWLDNLSLAERN